MLKPLLLSLTIALAGALAAQAQAQTEPQNVQDRSFTAASGLAGSVYNNTPTSDVSTTQNNVAPGWSDGTPDPHWVQAPSNTTTGTTQQNSYQGITNSIPVTTSMPFPGTYLAPGNLAGMQWGGPSLPSTEMGSFVARSGGNAFFIYGDEGEDGPPPLGDFETIGQGMAGDPYDNLTTGHVSNPPLPSSWGWTMYP